MMKTLKVKFILFSLTALLAVSFLTSCEQGNVAIKGSDKVDAYITLLTDENASLDEAHELYRTLNSEELVEANNIIIEKSIEQARQENDETTLNFFTQNQNNFSKFYSALESQAVELYGMSSNQLDSETLGELYEIGINKLNFVPFEEVQDEQIVIESRNCPIYNFPQCILLGGSKIASSNYSFNGLRYDDIVRSTDCDWIFRFQHGHYTKVNSGHSYVRNKLATLARCDIRARYIGVAGSHTEITDLILSSSLFFPVDRYWVQRQLRMGW